MNWLNILDPSGQVLLMLVAVALGAFVGLRREMEMQEQGVPGFVGFRTMPMIVLLGCLCTFFPLFPYMPIIGLIAIIGFLAIAYYNGVFQLQLLGLTSELATLIMYLVGMLVGYGYLIHAVLITVMIASFSAFKGQLHRFAGTISPSEWAGALQLLIISVIVLPVLPREAVDPWGAIVPYDVWLVVIFISAIGFIGYFLQKYLGKKSSVLLTSLLGSMVSSTVVTTHLAIEAKKDGEHKNTDLLILGIIIAIATMLLRVMLVMVVLTPANYAQQILLVPAVMIVSVVLVGLYWYGRSQDELQSIQEKHTVIKQPELHSPFDIIPALQFALLFIIVLLGVQLGQTYLGSYGVIATTFFSAFVDVDAAIVSVLQTLSRESIEISLVSLVVTIALVVNTMVKALYVWLISRDKQLSLQVLLVTGVASVVGIMAYALM